MITNKIDDNNRLYDHCARVIQRTWFNYQDRTIFKLLVMSIRVLENIDPKLIVRKLAPREFVLLNDRAFNLRIKFRLETSKLSSFGIAGESSFPPNVIYKILINDPNRFNFSSKVKGGKVVYQSPTCNNWRHLTIEPMINFIPKSNEMWQKSSNRHEDESRSQSRLQYQHMMNVTTPVVDQDQKKKNSSKGKTKRHLANRGIGYATRKGNQHKNIIPGYLEKYMKNYFHSDDPEISLENNIPNQMRIDSNQENYQNSINLAGGDNQNTNFSIENPSKMMSYQESRYNAVNPGYEINYEPDYVYPIHPVSSSDTASKNILTNKSSSSTLHRTLLATGDSNFSRAKHQALIDKLHNKTKKLENEGGLKPNAQQVFEKSLLNGESNLVNLEIDADLVNWVDQLDDQKLDM